MGKMSDVSEKWSRIGVLFVITLLFYLCLSVSSGVDLNGADLTQQETGGTFPNVAARENEPEDSAADTRPAGRTNITNGAETSPTDSQLLTSVTEERQEPSRSEEEKQIEAIMFRMFEDHLLANLDFETLPRPVNASLPPVPDYMFRLYQQLKVDTRQQRWFKTPDDTTYSEDTNDIFDETIRGYHVMSENWQRPGLRYLVFNTTCQPLKENITHVELVLYMCPSSAFVEPRENNGNTSKSEDNPPSLTPQHVNVTITMATKRRRRHSRIHLRLPVDSNHSYVPINITKMVQRSFAQRQTILNFSIETSSLTNPSVSQPCQFNRSEEEKRPLLVIYENILPFLESREYNFRRKRRASTAQNVTTGQEPTDSNTLPPIEIRAEVNWTDSAGNNTNSSDFVSAFPSGSALPPVTYDANATNTSSGSTSYPVNCHLRRWYISFVEMQWQHVILYPVGYYANYCWGLCPVFLDNVNSTNHAFIRSKYMLFHRLDPDIPKPFCSPIRMTPVTLLYRNKYDVIITKRFNEMVAAECSCM